METVWLQELNNKKQELSNKKQELNNKKQEQRMSGAQESEFFDEGLLLGLLSRGFGTVGAAVLTVGVAVACDTLPARL
ncbi:hypothetical protein LTS15_005687 [Exophiala xenobiotica]|nr:hypothetical protein LTS15_005687 [Exophiala xenobiotica]